MRLTADEVARTHTQVFNAALLSRDLDTLATLYADDYMLVRPDGSCCPRTKCSTTFARAD